jgi:hypothetical protein
MRAKTERYALIDGATGQYRGIATYLHFEIAAILPRGSYSLLGFVYNSVNGTLVSCLSKSAIWFWSEAGICAAPKKVTSAIRMSGAGESEIASESVCCACRLRSRQASDAQKNRLCEPAAHGDMIGLF